MTRILVACEESQKVATEFIKRGLDAYSCDIQPTRGPHPDKHIIGCALKEAYSGKYDMMIAFPPCTYLTRASASRLTRNGVCSIERYDKGLKAREFFISLLDAPIKYKCIENPTPLRVFNLPLHTQVIQPYQYGHPYTKRTLLWLKSLPPLQATAFVRAERSWCAAKRNPKYRSETFTGIAMAMADQWAQLL